MIVISSFSGRGGLPWLQEASAIKNENMAMVLMCFRMVQPLNDPCRQVKSISIDNYYAIEIKVERLKAPKSRIIIPMGIVC